MNGKITIVNDTYPNGQPFKRIVRGGLSLGSYTESGKGFLPVGKRKPRPTEFDALLDIIADRQLEVRRQAKWLQSARDELFERQHEFKA